MHIMFASRANYNPFVMIVNSKAEKSDAYSISEIQSYNLC